MVCITALGRRKWAVITNRPSSSAHSSKYLITLKCRSNAHAFFFTANLSTPTSNHTSAEFQVVKALLSRQQPVSSVTNEKHTHCTATAISHFFVRKKVASEQHQATAFLDGGIWSITCEEGISWTHPFQESSTREHLSKWQTRKRLRRSLLCKRRQRMI